MVSVTRAGLLRRTYFLSESSSSDALRRLTGCSIPSSSSSELCTASSTNLKHRTEARDRAPAQK